MTDRPLSKNMQEVLATIENAKKREISGWSIAKWLNLSRCPDGVRDALRALVNRGLITMRPMDDPGVEWRKLFPDRMKAMYSIAKKEGQ